MDDEIIISHFEKRNESAILEASEKYGKYILGVAFNVLKNREDANEVVNDTLLRAWNSIPPVHPISLKAYLLKLGRNRALDVYDRNTSEKRGGRETDECLDELTELLSKGETDDSPEAHLVAGELSKAISAFLETQKPEKRKIFVRRYFYLDSIEKIADDMLISKSNVKTSLFRTRESLKQYLIKEGLL